MVSRANHRIEILDQALELMLAKGYAATRIDEVCSAAGVTKGSFYHHFESKEALAARLVDHYFEGVLGALTTGRWSEVLDPTDRVLAFLDHAVKIAKGPHLRRGCLLGSFALDLSATHPAIRTVVQERLEELASLLEPLIRASFKHEGTDPGVSVPALARQFLSVLQGGIVLAKAYGEPAKLVEALRCFRRLFATLVGR